MRPATASRASRSRAARTTCAPADAIASAVAAPIPRLAPVTTARRPASPCPPSALDPGPAPRPGHLPVELFMSVEAPFQVELALSVVAAIRARQPHRPRDRAGGRVDVVGGDQEARRTVDNHLT